MLHHQGDGTWISYQNSLVSVRELHRYLVFYLTPYLPARVPIEFTGVMMEQLLPLNQPPIEKDIALFTTVLKICTDATASSAGLDRAQVLPPITFVLPLWPDLWEVLTQNRSHNLTLLVSESREYL